MRRITTILFFLITLPFFCWAQNIVINEIMSSNDKTIQDDDGDYPDWIELYNADTISINLNNWKLSDDTNNINKWIFPDINLDPNSYLVLFTSGKDKQGTQYLHTNFKIKSSGEQLYLCNSLGVLIDNYAAYIIPTDRSHGHKPDASGNKFLFTNPSPGYSNNFGATTENKTKLSFSHEAAYYTQELSLSINTTDELQADIYYTLNGSIPSPSSSYIYSSPLLLQNRLNDADSIALITTCDKWDTPKTNGFKINVVRAVAYRNGIQVSDVYTKTYCINKNMHTKYTMPIVSLAIEPENLFNEDDGIYVKGKHPLPDSANYMHRGEAYERPVHFEYFNLSGENKVSQDAGLRIHGGSSRSKPQKSLRLYARSEYGNSSFDYPFFHDKDINSFKRILLRSASSSDWKNTMFKDELTQCIAKNMNIDLQAFNPVIVFINGEYWGIHSIRERLDDNYIKSNFGYDDVDLIAFLYWVHEGDDINYKLLIDYVRLNDLRIEENYEHICNWIDIDNYIDYYIAELYFANQSWPWHNIEYWRPKTDTAKWRWILFDCDNSFNDVRHNQLFEYRDDESPLNNFPEWSLVLFRSLLQNKDFKNNFYQKFLFHLQSTFEPSRVIGIIDSLSGIYEPEVLEHTNRWNTPDSYYDWAENVRALKEFALERPLVMRNQLIEELGIPFSIYPNPASNNILLNIEPLSGLSENNEFSIQIYTAGGKRTEIIMDQIGDYSYSLNTNQLHSGVYIIRVQSAECNYHQKLIISK